MRRHHLDRLEKKRKHYWHGNAHASPCSAGLSPSTPSGGKLTRRQQVDGLICGHIHRPEIAQINGVNYFNCGDWVESCTALLEHHDGSIELVHCADHSAVLKTLPPVIDCEAA